MFWMYVLKCSENKLYIGSTNNIKRRIQEHNSGLVKSTKHRIPLKLVYAEVYTDENEARKREHNLKLYGRARKQLLLRIKKSVEP